VQIDPCKFEISGKSKVKSGIGNSEKLASKRKNKPSYRKENKKVKKKKKRAHKGGLNQESIQKDKEETSDALGKGLDLAACFWDGSKGKNGASPFIANGRENARIGESWRKMPFVEDLKSNDGRRSSRGQKGPRCGR